MFHELLPTSTPTSSIKPKDPVSKSAASTKASRLPQAVYRNTWVKSLPTSPKSRVTEVEPGITPPSRLPSVPQTHTPPSSIPRSTGQSNLRRLSIPPALLLRPVTEERQRRNAPYMRENVEPTKPVIRTLEPQAKDSPRTGVLRSFFRGSTRECPQTGVKN
jgi:hypothetical protein